MRADAACTRGVSHAAGAARCIVALWVLSHLAGCGALTSRKLPYAQLAAPYQQTQLKTTTTLDVLNMTRAPDYQLDADAVGETLLTQSDTAAALTGQSRNGLKTWVNLIVFNEHRMIAARKYFFCCDERAIAVPTDWLLAPVSPRRGLLFDAEIIVDPVVRTTPYATEEARQIAILEWLAWQFQADTEAVTGNHEKRTGANEMVSTAGMMMNQVFRGVLIEIDKSPGLARQLADPTGVEFPHISLGTGRIQMLVQDDIATVAIRVNLPMPSPQR